VLESHIPEGLLKARKMGLVEIVLCVAQDTWTPTKKVFDLTGKDKVNNHLLNQSNKLTADMDESKITWFTNSDYSVPSFADLLPVADLGSFKMFENIGDNGINTTANIKGEGHVAYYGYRTFVIKGLVTPIGNNDQWKQQFEIKVKSQKEALQAVSMTMYETKKCGTRDVEKVRYVKEQEHVGLSTKTKAVTYTVQESVYCLQPKGLEVLERYSQYETQADYQSEKGTSNYFATKNNDIKRFAVGHGFRDLSKLLNGESDLFFGNRPPVIDFKDFIMESSKGKQTLNSLHLASVNGKLTQLKLGYYSKMQSDQGLQKELSKARLSYELLTKFTLMGFPTTMDLDYAFRSPFFGANGIVDPYKIMQPILEAEKKEYLKRKIDFPIDLDGLKAAGEENTLEDHVAFSFVDTQLDRIAKPSEENKDAQDTAKDSNTQKPLSFAKAVEVVKTNFEEYYKGYLVKVGDNEYVQARVEVPETLAQHLGDLYQIKRIVELERQNMSEFPKALSEIQKAVRAKSEELGLREKSQTN
jgi:hypothetical protein